MSYCRFSSDQFRSDVYVYEHVGGYFAIHVAGNRVVSEKPRPEPAPAYWWKNGDEGRDAYIAAHAALDAWLEQADRVPIGLAHDGESFECVDAAACADKLVMLRETGYHVPEGVIEALREEAASPDSEGGEL